MTLDSFRIELQETERRQQAEANYKSWLDLFQRIDWNPERVVLALEADQNTLDALVEATQRRDLQIEADKGKKVWRAIRDYYLNNNHQDMLAVMNRGVYEATAPEWRRGWLGLYASVFAAAAFTLTLGAAKPVPILEAIDSRAHRKYAGKLLGYME